MSLCVYRRGMTEKLDSLSVLVKKLSLFTITSRTGELTGATVIHHPDEQVGDWQAALAYLKAGNKRYLENRTIKRKTSEKDRAVLKNGQMPFTVIVTCSDSRLSPEIYFDQKPGDLFVIRNAGNIVDATALGSIEYAVGHLKVPLVVVVGHNSCGAVTSALAGGKYSKNLQTIIDAINPAIGNCKDLDNAISMNTDYTVERIKRNEIVRHMGATVKGAHYNIETGEVSFR